MVYERVFNLQCYLTHLFTCSKSVAFSCKVYLNCPILRTLCVWLISCDCVSLWGSVFLTFCSVSLMLKGLKMVGTFQKFQNIVGLSSPLPSPWPFGTGMLPETLEVVVVSLGTSWHGIHSPLWLDLGDLRQAEPSRSTSASHLKSTIILFIKSTEIILQKHIRYWHVTDAIVTHASVFLLKTYVIPQIAVGLASFTWWTIKRADLHWMKDQGSSNPVLEGQCLADLCTNLNLTHLSVIC